GLEGDEEGLVDVWFKLESSYGEVFTPLHAMAKKWKKQEPCDGEPNETMIQGRLFLTTIHAQIDVFKREISLGFGEDRVSFDMDGNEKFYEGTSYPWHDEGFKEQERWESGIEKIDYEPPFVDTETIEIKRHSFKGGRSFICITKQLDDAFPLGRVNGSRFIGMIKKEMDEEGGTIRKTRIRDTRLLRIQGSRDGFLPLSFEA
ncbi:hypothetical protein Tco_1379237, partial [Tanacetum coccineum]